MTSTKPIQVGDRVAYSTIFLQSTGQHSGEIPFARGTVTALKTFGAGATTIAEVNWGSPSVPAKVNIANLVTIEDLALGR